MFSADMLPGGKASPQDCVRPCSGYTEEFLELVRSKTLQLRVLLHWEPLCGDSHSCKLTHMECTAFGLLVTQDGL